MSLLALAGTNSATGGYEIDNSLKFESDNSEYLSRTYSSTTNRRTWTVSAWVKRAELGSNQVIISGGDYLDVTGVTIMQFLANDTLNLYTHSNQLTTTRVFRDTSAWYHIVWAVDSTQSTAADRVNVYINGEQITDLTGSYPVLNWDSAFNYSAYESNIGRYSYERDRHFNGYMTVINFVDGSQLASTDFGEFDDDTGIWKPKAYTGSYGTNGFKLEFKSSGSLGADTSGNGNNFTLNNITAADQATDTPTNNFCTMNPLYNYAYGNTITEGATKIYGAPNNWGGGKATFGLTSGKWYWEVKQLANANTFMGIQTDGEDNISSGNAHSQNTTVCFYTDGTIQYSNGSETSTSASNSIAANSIVGFALDLDSATQTIKVYNNNSLVTAFGSSGTANLSTYNIADKTVFPFVALYDRTVNMNFGGYTVSSISSAASDANGYGNFEYAPPSGYYALCTKNLEEFG